MKFSSAIAVWRGYGTFAFIRSGVFRIVRSQVSFISDIYTAVADAQGIEIGGPSRRFSNHDMVPIYSKLKSIDNVNFSSHTVWEGCLEDETLYSPTRELNGVQYIREATELNGISDDAYDLVLSSHCLEHIANPLKALKEWRRICRPGGYLCLIVPHRDGTFDWKRPVTTMQHFYSDDRYAVGEDDDTHFEEIIRLHDFRRDQGLKSEAELKERVKDNLRLRTVHHHVFNLSNTIVLVRSAGWSLIAAEARRPFDIVIFAQNLERIDVEDSLKVPGRSSPFRSDKAASRASVNEDHAT